MPVAKNTITFALELARIAQLSTLAHENNRSLSGEIRALLLEGLRARGIDPAPLAPTPNPKQPCPNS